jgi:hypothetical protein
MPIASNRTTRVNEYYKRSLGFAFDNDILSLSLCLVLEENKDVDSAAQHEEKKKHEYQHQRWI